MARRPRFMTDQADVEALRDDRPENPRAVMGDNAPPDPMEAARRAFGDLMDELDERFAALSGAIARAPAECKTQDDAQAYVTVGKQISLLKADYTADKIMGCFDLLQATIDAAKARVKAKVEGLDGLKATVYRRIEPYVLTAPDQKVTNEHGNRAYMTARKQVIEVEDPSEVPPWFMIPDEKSIKAAVERGETVPGVTVTPSGKKVVIS